MDKVKEIYENYSLRIDINQWEKLLNNENYWRLDVKQILFTELFGFLLNHYHLPHKIWLLLDECFLWTKQREHLYKKFGDHVDFLLDEIDNTVEFNYNFPVDKPFDYDSFLLYREQAFWALFHGNFELAKESIDQAQAIYSEDYDLIRIRGFYYCETGDYQKALKEFNDLLEIKRDDIDAYFRRADLYIKLRQYKDALKDYQWLLERIPQDPNALSGLARCYMALGNLLEAKTVFEYIIELYPCDIHAYLQIYSIDQQLINHYRLKLQEEAEQDSLRITIAQLLYELGWYDKCFEEIQKMLNSPKVNSSLYLLAGKALCRLEKYEEGLVWLEKALDLAYINKENGYEILVERGNCYFAMDHLDKAISDFLTAVNINPYDAELLYQLADALRIKGMYKESLEKANRAIGLNPDKWRYHALKGVIHFYNFDYEKARDELQMIVEQNPEHIQMWFCLAYSYLKSGDYQKAKESFKVAIDWAVGFDDLIWFYLFRAENYITMQNYYSAQKDIETYKKAKANSFAGYLMSGCLYYLMNNKSKAITEFCTASDRLQTSFSLAKAAFCACYEKGMPDKTLIYLKRMMNIDAADEWLQVMIAKVLMQLTSKKDAFLLIDDYCDSLKNQMSKDYQDIYLFILLSHLKSLAEENPSRYDELVNYISGKEDISKLMFGDNKEIAMPVSKERKLFSQFVQDKFEYKLEDICQLSLSKDNILGQLNWIEILIEMRFNETALCDLYLIIQYINHMQEQKEIDSAIYIKLIRIFLCLVRFITVNYTKDNKALVDKALVVSDEMLACLEKKNDAHFGIYAFRLSCAKNLLLCTIEDFHEWLRHSKELMQKYKDFKDYEIQKWFVINLLNLSRKFKISRPEGDYHEIFKWVNEFSGEYLDSENLNFSEAVFNALVAIGSAELEMEKVDKDILIEICDKVLDFYKKRNDCPVISKVGLIACICNKAMILGSLGQFDKAKGVLDEAEEIARVFGRSVGNMSYPAILCIRGATILKEFNQKFLSGHYAECNKKELKQALKYFEKALKFKESYYACYAKECIPYTLFLMDKMNNKSNYKKIKKLLAEIQEDGEKKDKSAVNVFFSDFDFDEEYKAVIKEAKQ